MIRYLFIALTSFLLFACNSSDKKITQKATETEVLEQNGDTLTPQEFMLDSEKSIINWVGRKPTGEHRGTVNFLHGALFQKSDGSFEGTVQADMNTIACIDIEDEEDNTDLVNHLKDKDFFNVNEFQTATFEIREYQYDNGDSLSDRIGGEITIKGKSEAFMIPVRKTQTGDSLLLSGTFVIDRTRFGIEYKSKSVFPKLKDKFIDDNIELSFDAWFYNMKMEQTH